MFAPRSPNGQVQDFIDGSSRLSLPTGSGLGRLGILCGHQNQGPITRASGITRNSRTTSMSKISPTQMVDPAWPILMTSLAFILGVMPMAVSTGAGAASRHDMGTGVIGGMVSATLLAIFFVPVFYVIIRRIFKGSAAPAPGGFASGDKNKDGAKP